MNAAHLHMMLTHFPVAGTFLAIPLLLFALWKKNETLKLAGLVLVLVTGLLTAGAYLTGEGAEEIIEKMPGASMDLIHEHEEAALFSLIFLGLNGLLGAFGLFTYLKKKSLPHWVFLAVLVLTLFCSTVVARVSYLGGQIQHAEARPGFTPPAGDH